MRKKYEGADIKTAAEARLPSYKRVEQRTAASARRAKKLAEKVVSSCTIGVVTVKNIEVEGVRTVRFEINTCPQWTLPQARR